MKTSLRTVVVGLMAGAMITGCSKDEKTAPTPNEAPAASATPTPIPSARPAACSTVSADRLEKLGYSSEGKSSTSGGADVCTWMGDGGSSLIVQIFPTASHHEHAREQFESFFGAKADSLSGPGDDAFYIPGKTGPLLTATVGAKKGQTAISVQTLAMSGQAEALKATAVDVTRDILEKL